MARTADLFGPRPRRPRRVMMTMRDAGHLPGGAPGAEYECRRCGFETGWIHTPFGPRGGHRHLYKRPCPRCNGGSA